MQQKNARRVAFAAQFRDAIERSEFLLFYQPQINISDGSVAGMEALLRWQHPDHGLLTPADFLEALEGSHYDIPVGRFVVDTAVRQASAWHRAGMSTRISINVSSAQVHGEELIAVLDEALDQHGLPAPLLEVEITERVALGGSENVQRILSDISTRGVSIAFDDFGTGYASLSSLTRFPIDTVKVDKTFVSGLEGDLPKQKLLGGLIGLCQQLGCGVIAEGVETGEQEAFLREHGCPVAQGYYYRRPLSADAADFFLRRQASLRSIS